ncbi:HD domain-containing protein [Lactobacillus sp. DCY120]|uniref:HD domain-containing protein n=1 Tax=Bombilactobacillus apium TaxID=2675299 RepID=A0A850RC44_9LACO|nr:HD domain-containing protein [Bombilactobacillus apium]NVY96876.1 HD domain-containing protein [Bombilactobacillus apium]
MKSKLATLKAGSSFEMPVLIDQMTWRTAKNGSHFLDLVFSDRSGKLPGKYWNATIEDTHKFVVGTVVILKGKCELYNGSLQVKINSLTLDPQAKHLVAELTPQAPLTKVELQEAVQSLLLEIVEPHWNRIVRALLKRHQDSFYEYPAAKSNHHDYRGGLAFHTLSIARLAQDVCRHYPQVNASLLLAGTFLHDLGKTTELSGSVGTQYTVAGNLLGHIVLIDEEIITACQQLQFDPNDEKILLLRHMIIAHHGLNEYGSPKRPQILEAEILHDLDELDAAINMITKATAKTLLGEFSAPVFGLDNRRFYVPQNID